MKILIAFLLILSSSAFAQYHYKGLDALDCVSGGLRVTLTDQKKGDVRVSIGAVSKSYDLFEVRYLSQDLAVREPFGSYVRKQNFTRIMINNPDNTLYDKELYVIELSGNLLTENKLVSASGTIRKSLIPYSRVPGVYLPVQSPEVPVSCKVKLRF